MVVVNPAPDPDAVKIGPGPYILKTHIPDIPAPGNPIPVIVHGAEYAWDDVSGWAKGAFDTVTGWFDSAASVAADDVRAVVHSAMDTVQTAWSSFISELEGWIVEGIDAVTQSVTDLGNFTIAAAQAVWNVSAAYTDAVAQWILADVTGIEGRLSGLEHLIEDTAIGTIDLLETWAIDNIYHPLLTDIGRVEADVWDAARWVSAEAEAYARDLVDSEAFRRALAIAGVAAAVGAITTWVEECGDPMCQTIGPKTDLGKILKGLQFAADLALITELANMDEAKLAALLRTIAAKAGALVSEFETGFVQGGETIGELIAKEIAAAI